MHTLSLSAAVFININIMFGAGLFINTTELAHRAGALGWLAYALIGILMLPLILSIAFLARIHPQGGFYTYASKELHPFFGFVSAWSYFTAKLASATLGLYAATLLLQALIPSLTCMHPLFMSFGLLLFFVFLNTHNIRTGSLIQNIFLSAKVLPFVCVCFAGLLYFSPTNLQAVHNLWSGIPQCMPLVLFTVLGFEASCSLSSKIKDSEKNTPRAIIISFITVIGIYCLYQFFTYNIFGTAIYSFVDYRVFFSTLSHLFSPAMQNLLVKCMYGSVALSALGGSYGILYSNIWNLYTLAQHGALWSSSQFTHVNKHHIPVMCVVAELVICSGYLLFSWGSQLPLQQIAAVGCSFSYAISVFALIVAKYKRQLKLFWFIPLLGFGNCLLLFGLSITYLLRGGSPALYVFFSLFLCGIIMYSVQQKNAPKLL